MIAFFAAAVLLLAAGDEAHLDADALAVRARRLGLDREPRFRRARAFAELKVLAQLAAEHHRDRLQGAPVTEPELRQAYALRAEALAGEPRFTARQLVVYVEGNPAFPERGRPDAEARARAGEGLAALHRGEGWDAVARAWSDEPGTSARGGLARDVPFERVPPEAARAARTQPLGVPGPPFRSALGWHVVQVEARITHPAPPPLDEVRDALARSLAAQRAADAREVFLYALRAEVGLRLGGEAEREGPLLDDRVVPPAATLAEVDGQVLREEDFRWFVKDALLPRQRRAAGARPGARRALVAAFLELHVLAAKARRDGLDRTPAFAGRLARTEEALLGEFAEAADGMAPPGLCSAAGPRGQGARRVYLDRLRGEAGLSPGAAAPAGAAPAPRAALPASGPGGRGESAPPRTGLRQPAH